MFTGSIKEWSEQKNYLPPVFARAMSLFLMSERFARKPGHYQLEGEDIYVNVEEGPTKPESEGRFEMHKKYVDIQIVLEGRERMDYSTESPTRVPIEDHFITRDLAFYEPPKNPQRLYLEAGQFAIFFPNELHAPNLAFDKPEKHRKAVLKIRASLI